MSQTEHTHYSRISDGLPGWVDMLAPVPGIEPVDGWSLRYLSAPIGWLAPTEYIAVSASQTVLLGVSRWAFDPTQDRFAWLVCNGFPSSVRRPHGTWTPVDNADIDAALAAKVAA